MGSPIRSYKGQQKSIREFGACSEVPFVLKECNYIDWDTLELDIYEHQTIILTPLILIYELKTPNLRLL